jgi:hypothetical protein
MMHGRKNFKFLVTVTGSKEKWTGTQRKKERFISLKSLRFVKECGD